MVYNFFWNYFKYIAVLSQYYKKIKSQCYKKSGIKATFSDFVVIKRFLIIATFFVISVATIFNEFATFYSNTWRFFNPSSQVEIHFIVRTKIR